ncbi:hypothetical protein FB451DRAFT_1184181 [Mycena latifolia]|nr:hypothetical protein FB451DRAFT_1184181 [Mycena latifolia]
MTAGLEKRFQTVAACCGGIKAVHRNCLTALSHPSRSFKSNVRYGSTTTWDRTEPYRRSRIRLSTAVAENRHQLMKSIVELGPNLFRDLGRVDLLEPISASVVVGGPSARCQRYVRRPSLSRGKRKLLKRVETCERLFVPALLRDESWGSALMPVYKHVYKKALSQNTLFLIQGGSARQAQVHRNLNEINDLSSATEDLARQAWVIPDSGSSCMTRSQSRPMSSCCVVVIILCIGTRFVFFEGRDVAGT